MESFLKHLDFVAHILCRGFNLGHCPICEEKTLFYKEGNWLRDQYRCIRCKSIPRNRALLQVLEDYFVNWRDMNIHESSPSGTTFQKFSSECANYIPTHFYPDISRGNIHLGFRCEDLTQQTFDDESFDIVITQDVFEHLLEPCKAFQEIYRTLKPGGSHVFTVPWFYWQETKVRARMNSGKIEYLEKPDYHGNPIDSKGSLVVTEWGQDLCEIIFACSGMITTAIRIKDKYLGIDAKFIEVFVSRKSAQNIEEIGIFEKTG